MTPNLRQSAKNEIKRVGFIVLRINGKSYVAHSIAEYDKLKKMK
jgi:hypothetical protein